MPRQIAADDKGTRPMEFAIPQPGDTIAGRFELIGKIGAGAFGAVFKARQLGIDRQVALKLLMPEADNIDATAVARFKREAKLSSSLEHPNTITIHDYGEWQGILYLAMEYVRGLSLKEVLKKDGRLPPERAVKITAQILSSLSEAHSRGIIHRDMKPANIMTFDRFGEKDVVKVLDFGIAKFVSNDNDGMGAAAVQDDLTVAGRIVGTPRYMAPEQVKGVSPSPASDLYSLSLILYEMISGKKAVSGDSTMTLIAMQLSPQSVIDPQDASVPPALMPVILKAANKDPAARYQNAKEFLDALERTDLTMGPAPVPAGPPPMPGILPPSSKVIVKDDSISLDADFDSLVVPESGANKGLLIAALVLGVLLIVVAAIAAPIIFGGDDDPPATAALNADTKTDGAPGDADKADEKAAKKDEEKPEEKQDEPPAEPEKTTLALKIATTPEGAKVMNGDAELGQTPYEGELDPEKVGALTLKLDGHEDATIKVNEEMDTDLTIDLKKIVKPRAVTNRPPANKGVSKPTKPTKPPAGKGAGSKKNDYKPL